MITEVSYVSLIVDFHTKLYLKAYDNLCSLDSVYIYIQMLGIGPQGLSFIFSQLFFKFNLYCVFFRYHLAPLHPPTPSNHHTVVHVHESFFFSQ